MFVDPAALPPPEVYQHLVHAVLPRPIAWVTSVDGQGRVNLAPYSFFNVFSANPPVVAFAPTRRRDGSTKDTLANVQATGCFTVNVVSRELAERMNQTAAELPTGVNEAEAAGVELLPGNNVPVPRVAAAPASLECRVRDVIPLGDGPISGTLVLGTVVGIHLLDAALGADGRLDPARVVFVGRLGKEGYCTTADRFDLKRP